MMLSISSLEIITIVVPEQLIYFWMTGSVVDAAAVNLDGVKTLLGNGLITFFIKDNPGFSNGPRCLPRSRHDCATLDICVFYHFILDDKLFGKAFWKFETCLSVSNNLCGKLVLLLDSINIP